MAGTVDTYGFPNTLRTLRLCGGTVEPLWVCGEATLTRKFCFDVFVCITSFHRICGKDSAVQNTSNVESPNLVQLPLSEGQKGVQQAQGLSQKGHRHGVCSFRPGSSHHIEHTSFLSALHRDSPVPGLLAALPKVLPQDAIPLSRWQVHSCQQMRQCHAKLPSE